MIAAAQAAQVPLAVWVPILVGLAGLAVWLLKGGQKYGRIEQHLQAQDQAIARQDEALAAQDAVLDAQNRELAALHAKLDYLSEAKVNQ